MNDINVDHDGRRLARDSAYERDHTTLLFVDMQRIWVAPELDPYSRPSDGYYHDRIARTVVPNQTRLLTAARGAGIDIVHTIIQSLTHDGRDRSLDHKLSDIHIPPDAPSGQVIPELAPVGNEITFPKTSSGVFNSTNIDYVLRNLTTRYLIVAGVVTDQCVDMAVRDAADRGYLVTLVDDACATDSATRHEAAVDALSGYCWVAPTDTVVERLTHLQ